MESAPPDDVRPGQAGTLLDGVANPCDVTATIVDLAVRGYLRIEDHRRTDVAGLVAGPARQGRRPACLRADTAGWAVRGPHDGTTCDAAFRARPRIHRASQAGTGRSLCGRGRTRLVHRPPRPGPPEVGRHRLSAIRDRRGSGDRGGGHTHLGLVPIPAALAGLVLIGGARWMPARTAKGTALARRVAGFRTFIRTTAAPGPARRATRHAVR